MDTHATVLCSIEDVIAILTSQLGLVHGLIGLAQELVGINVLILWIKGHTNAG
jgi:hypothetical protein